MENNRSMQCNKHEGSSHSEWYIVTLLYLINDYARLQDIIPIGAFRPMMVLISILTLFAIRYGMRYSITFAQIKIIWLFIALLALHVPFARNNFLAFNTAQSMLLYVPFLVSVVFLVNTVHRLKIITRTMVILVGYVTLYCITHLGSGSGNYFADENDVALFIITWLPLGYFLMFTERRQKLNLLYLSSLIVGVLGVVKSFSRGGFVGLVAMMVVAWFYSSKKILSFVLVCVLATVVYLAGGHKYMEEMSTVADTSESTARERLLSWQAGWGIFLDHPLGVGGNNFPVWFPHYQSDELRRNMWGRVAHSIWFTVIPELGLPGIVLYGLLLIYNLGDVLFMIKLGNVNDSDFKLVSALAKSYLAGMVGFFAAGTFLSVLYYPHYWYMTALIVATRRIADSLQERNFGMVNV